MADQKLSAERIAKTAYAHCFKASEIAPQGVQLYLFDVKRLGAFIEALASPPVAVQEERDARPELIEKLAGIGYEAGQASLVDRGPAWSKLPVTDALVWMNAAEAILAAMKGDQP